MKLGLHFRDALQSVSPLLVAELDQVTEAVRTSFGRQHDAEGRHAAITATSAVMTGDVSTSGTITATAAVIRGDNPTLHLFDTSEPADSRAFYLANADQGLYVRALNDAYTTIVSTPLILSRGGDATVGRDVYEKGRPVAVGHWQDVPFNAAHFWTGTSLVWTVDAGDVQTNRYALVGKTLVWTVYLNATTLSGTAGTQLLITLPGGFTGRGYGTMYQLYDGAQNQGLLFVGGTTYVTISKYGGGNFALNTNGTYLIFTLTLEIV